MVTHSSILAWEISWTEEPGRLQSIGLHRVGHDWSDLAQHKDSSIPSNRSTHIANHSTVKYTSLQLYVCASAAVKSLQLCLTLCNPIDGSPPGSAVPGILQARILGWVAISFSNGWKWKVKLKSFSRVRLLATPLTAAYQAPPSMGFSRQEYWSGVPSPSLWCVCSEGLNNLVLSN